MSLPIIININNEERNFILTGNLQGILANNRLVFSLKRLKYKYEEDKILIPYEEKTKIKILQEIQSLLEKFECSSDFSTETKKEVASYDIEQQTFKENTDKANKIRNNKFDDNPELINDFDLFQKVLKEKLVRPLYPRQLLSAFHMAFSQNSCNFSVPGAGKTTIVYGAYAYLKSLPENDDKHVDKILIIGPISSFAPWESEYKKCFGAEVKSQRLSGDNKISRSHKEQHLFSGNPAELTLIAHGGMENLKQEIVSFLRSNKTMVVVDEAHRIKNPEGVWGKSVVEIAKEAKSKVILTGTPVPNGYEDLFNLFQFLYPYKFKEILKFHYNNLVDMTKSKTQDSDRVREFINNISPFFIRIKKSDLKLPPINEHKVEVNMDPLQREIYDFIETKYVKSFKKNSSAELKDVLNRAKLIRLRQAATNPSLLLKSIEENLDFEDNDYRLYSNSKMPEEFQNDSQILSKIYSYSKIETPKKFLEIKKLLDEKILINDGKVIIWTIFIQNAKELQKYLSQNGLVSKLLIGEIEQKDREVVIKKFNNPKNFEFRIIIANPFSVAESISLHEGCHNAIYLERDYNCSNFLQSKDRIHRYGLSANQETNYFYMLSDDSIDEIIDEKLQEKIERMEKIIDEDIPLFSRINDNDETDLIKALLDNYARKNENKIL